MSHKSIKKYRNSLAICVYSLHLYSLKVCKSFYRVFAQPKQTKQNESACDEWAELRKRRLRSWAACATSNVCFSSCCCCCSQKYHAQKKRETERRRETVGEQTTKFEGSALQCACVTIFGIFCWVRFNIGRVLCGCVCVCVCVRCVRGVNCFCCFAFVFFSYCVCVCVCVFAEASPCGNLSLRFVHCSRQKQQQQNKEKASCAGARPHPLFLLLRRALRN